MKLALTILQLLPYVFELIRASEAAFPAGKGKEKLDFVLSTIESVFSTVGGIGSTVPWAQIVGPIGAIIEKFVAAMNAVGSFTHGK